MTFKKVQDAEQIGTYMANGKEVPILKPEVLMEVKNLKTGQEYDSEDHAKSDVDDPETETTQDHIQKNIEIKVTKLPDVFGATKKDD